MGIKFIISHVLCDCNRRDLCNKECSLFIERCSVVSLADNIKTPAVAVQNMLEKTPHSVSRMRYLNHVHLALLQSLKGLPVLCSQKKACIYKSELFDCIFKITFDTIFFSFERRNFRKYLPIVEITIAKCIFPRWTYFCTKKTIYHLQLQLKLQIEILRPLDTF